MKKIYFILTLMLILISILTSNPVFAADKINWYTSYQEAERDANVTKMPMMIYFYDDWHSDCKKIEKETFTDSTVIAMAQHFICVKLDRNRYSNITDKYSILWYPAILFLNPKGYYLNQVSGFVNSDTLTAEMEKAIKKLK